MSESSVSYKRMRFVQLWPLMFISIGIVISFLWAGFLAWLILAALFDLI
jgi:hypothetical protein